MNGVIASSSIIIILEGTVAQHSFCYNFSTLLFTVTPEAVHAEVVALGSPVFFRNFSLLCSVYEAEIFQPTIVYKWLKNDEQQTSNSQLSILSFDSLSLSDVAEYRCEVTLSSSVLSNDVLVSSGSYELTFERKPPFIIQL